MNKKIDYCEEIKNLEKVMINAPYLIAEYLYEINKNKLYKPKYPNFRSFCKTLPYKNRNIYAYLGVYKKFIVQLGYTREQLQYVNFTGLIDTMAVVKTKRDAEYWLDMISTSTRIELRQMVKDEKKKLSTHVVVAK